MGDISPTIAVFLLSWSIVAAHNTQQHVCPVVSGRSQPNTGRPMVNLSPRSSARSSSLQDTSDGGGHDRVIGTSDIDVKTYNSTENQPGSVMVRWLFPDVVLWYLHACDDRVRNSCMILCKVKNASESTWSRNLKFSISPRRRRSLPQVFFHLASFPKSMVLPQRPKIFTLQTSIPRRILVSQRDMYTGSKDLQCYCHWIQEYSNF